MADRIIMIHEAQDPQAKLGKKLDKQLYKSKLSLFNQLPEVSRPGLQYLHTPHLNDGSVERNQGRLV